MDQTGYVSPPPSPPWDADSIGLSPPIDYSSLVPPSLVIPGQDQKRDSLSGPPQRYLNYKRASQGHPPPYRNRCNRASMPIQIQEQKEQMDNDIYKYDKPTAPPRPKFHYISEADSNPVNISRASTRSESTQTSGSDTQESTTEPQTKRKPTPPGLGSRESAQYKDINQKRYYQPTIIGMDKPDLSLDQSQLEHDKLASITINIISSDNETLWSKTCPEIKQNRPIIMGPPVEALRRGKVQNKPVSTNLLKRLRFKSRSRGRSADS
ncbi:hypothetical protein N7478_007938 [Penicillium angulare]|uniref:uncharacterized protein n=1 Tax=Penicillium angulare TaxID=116970 RepID=UPI0025416C6C|nr:uncharacterized protein N7478_007938 [Penicillium angulare]KAJ5272813.1 hypothetical protein N7478_007938 [Penicillium angulare]